VRPAALALTLALATACGSLFPATPTATGQAAAVSPTPAASASQPALRTPSPVPSGSSVPRVQTPRPALGLPLVNAQCSEWPRDVADLQTHLSMPTSLCFLRGTADLKGDLVCTVVGCVPVTSGCVDQGYCILAVEGLTSHYVFVFIRPPEGLPPPIAETATVTRSLCRLHQFRSLLDAVVPGEGLPPEGWLTTEEAREFATAFVTFRSTYPSDAVRWEPKASDEENYADVCAAWYYPPARPQKVADYTPLLAWATKWLPQ
jgi:hypothetical protein